MTSKHAKEVPDPQPPAWLPIGPDRFAVLLNWLFGSQADDRPPGRDPAPDDER